MSDLVYIVGPEGVNDYEELRYSLRSVVKNLKHDKVWVFGTAPSWYKGLYIPLPPLANGFDNQKQSLTTAVWTGSVSEDFVLMQDDYFVMKPMEEPEVYHLGPLRDYLRYLEAHHKADNDWHLGLKAAARELPFDAFSYETHSPLPFKKTEVRGLLSSISARPFAYLSYYPLTSGPVGVKGHDAKNAAIGSPYLSTADWSWEFDEVGQYVRSIFREPSRYER